jgi:Predicted membrane protein (DUF2207).
MRKSIGIGLLIAIVVGLFVMFVPDEDGEYVWNPFDYARITDVDYKAVVVDEPESNGKIVVTERLTFDIHAFSKNNRFWELWRDLGEDYIDGVKVEFKVNSVKQIFDDGRAPVEFAESPRLYWEDYDYTTSSRELGPGKWYHSEGPYNERRRQYECVFFYVDGLYRETVVFEIEYEMYNAALRWEDSSELYISLFSGRDVNHLKSFKGQILFPNEKMPKSSNYYANTYGTNSHTFPFTESTTMNPGYHTFSFELNEPQLKFRKYNEYIEFALVSFGEDKHIFTQYASKNYYYNDDALGELKQEQVEYDALPHNFKIIKMVILLLLSGGTALTIILVFAADKMVKKKHIFYQPTIPFEYFREIPSELDPNFASALAFCKHKSEQDIQDGYSAVMLSLAHKEYIELGKINNAHDWDFNNVKIIVKYKPIQLQPQEDLVEQEQVIVDIMPPLTQTEELYFNLILRHAYMGAIPLKTFQQRVSLDYEHTNSFVKNIKSAITTIGVSQGYFQKADYQKPKKQARDWVIALLIIGALLMVVGNLISYQTRLDLAFGAFFISGIGFISGAIILNTLFKKHVLLTQFGVDEYAKWRGLYNFLNSETLLNERTVVELPLWEKYLIYATAFGISEKVIKALEIRCPNADDSPVLRRNSYYRTRSFRSRVGRSSFRSATRSASNISRFGSSGGYGGGGRGGGGGGGGH